MISTQQCLAHLLLYILFEIILTWKQYTGQVIDYYQSGCGCTTRYRLVHRCHEGFCPDSASCRANNNQVIAYRPIFVPRYCRLCEIDRLNLISDVYQIYADEIDPQACRELWPRERRLEAHDRCNQESEKERDRFLDVLSERENQDETRFESWRRQGRPSIPFIETESEDLSDEEEQRALEEDSDSEWEDGPQSPIGGFDQQEDVDDADDQSSEEDEEDYLLQLGIPLNPPSASRLYNGLDEGHGSWCEECGVFHGAEDEDEDDDNVTSYSTDHDYDGTDTGNNHSMEVVSVTALPGDLRAEIMAISGRLEEFIASQNEAHQGNDCNFSEADPMDVPSDPETRAEDNQIDLLDLLIRRIEDSEGQDADVKDN